MKHTIKPHPTYAKLIPLPSIEQLITMENDIKKTGVRNKIIVNQKYQIIDGYTRFKIAKNLGIKIPFEVKKFKDKRDELNFIISTNLHRRHLTSFQKVMIFLHIYEDLLKQNPRKTGVVKPGFCKLIGVSSTVLTKCLKVLKSGTKEQINLVRNKERTVESVYNEINKEKSLLHTRMCPLCSGKGFLNEQKKLEYEILVNLKKPTVAPVEI